MKLKIGNLYITEYCSNDLKKYHFTKELSNDELIKKYISPDISTWIELSENLNRVCVGPGYLIGNNIDLIGAFKISNMTKEGYLNFDYMISKNYRNTKEHYGTMLVSELTDFLLNYFLFIRGIELAIDRTNIASIKCVTKAGFEFKKKSDLTNEFNIYVKNRRFK